VIKAKSVFSRATRDRPAAPLIDAEGTNLQCALVSFLFDVFGCLPCRVPVVLYRHTLLFRVTDDQLAQIKRAHPPAMFSLCMARTDAPVYGGAGETKNTPPTPNVAVVNCPPYLGTEKLTEVLVRHLGCDANAVKCEQIMSAVNENPPNALAFYFCHPKPETMVGRTIVFHCKYQARFVLRKNITYWRASARSIGHRDPLRNNESFNAARPPPPRAGGSGPTFTTWNMNKRTLAERGEHDDGNNGRNSSRGYAPFNNENGIECSY
jgi:hypothetical protein